MSRTPTPSIMDELTFTKPDKIEQEKTKAIKPASNKAIKDEGNKNQVDDIAQKEKATFNLPVTLLTELEDKWMKIRKLSGSKQMSKTLIVETALEMAFEDFANKEQESKLYCKLADKKEIEK